MVTHVGSGTMLKDFAMHPGRVAEECVQTDALPYKNSEALDWLATLTRELFSIDDKVGLTLFAQNGARADLTQLSSNRLANAIFTTWWHEGTANFQVYAVERKSIADQHKPLATPVSFHVLSTPEALHSAVGRVGNMRPSDPRHGAPVKTEADDKVKSPSKKNGARAGRNPVIRSKGSP